MIITTFRCTESLALTLTKGTHHTLCMYRSNAIYMPSPETPATCIVRMHACIYLLHTTGNYGSVYGSHRHNTTLSSRMLTVLPFVTERKVRPAPCCGVHHTEPVSHCKHSPIHVSQEIRYERHELSVTRGGLTTVTPTCLPRHTNCLHSHTHTHTHIHSHGHANAGWHVWVGSWYNSTPSTVLSYILFQINPSSEQQPTLSWNFHTVSNV